MTLKVAEHPEEREKCSWTVPADLRNMYRDDAKVAVVHPAFKQGAMKLFHFKGESPPEGYKVELTSLRESKEVKRKAADGTENEGQPSKKTKQVKQSPTFRRKGFRNRKFDDPNEI